MNTITSLFRPIVWFFSLNPNFGQEQRRRSILLRILVIALILTLPFFAIAVQIAAFNAQLNLILLGMMACFLIAQFLNRLGYVKMGAWLGILSMVLPTLYYISQPTSGYPVLTYINYIGPLLLVPVLIAGVTIGPLASPLVGLLCVGGLVVISSIEVKDTDIFLAIRGLSINVFLLVLVSILSWLFERYVAQLLGELTLRNQELELRNAELAAKRTLEQQIGDRLNVLAAQVSSASAEQSRGANDQLSGVVEATTTLEELNQTNKQIARAAQQVASSAQNALQVAEHGGETIKSSVLAMTVLQERVGNISTSMDDLFSQSQEIDQIIELISGVADETNLLALNATIEAAGAREYGRRFAAVANEVQRLAGRTSEAAESVRLVIGEVQDAIRKATAVTKQGLDEASRLAANASEVGETIENMVQMVQNTTILAQQISFSIQQQESAGTQVVDTMRQISVLSRQMSERTHDLLSSIFELNETADRLRELENQVVGPDSSGDSNSTNELSLLALAGTEAEENFRSHAMTEDKNFHNNLLFKN